MKNPYILLAVLMLVAVCAFGQTTSPDSGPDRDESRITVELSKSLDAKKTKVGDPVVARLMDDVVLNGKKVAPWGSSKLVGHVTQAQPRSQDSPTSILGIIFDRIVLKDGQEIAVTTVVLAFNAPVRPLPHTMSVPTSVDDPMARAAGPVTDSHGQRVFRTPPPLTRTITTAGGNPGNVPMREDLKAPPEGTSAGVVVTSKTHNARLEGNSRLVVRITNAGK